MPINPRELQNLGSMTEARRHIQGINFEARNNASQMHEAGQKLSEIHQHINNVMDAGHSAALWESQEHLDDALQAHDSGNIADALKHARLAHASLKAGYREKWSRRETSPELQGAMDNAHKAFDEYYKAAAPASLVNNRNQTARGTISVAVSPSYLEKTNPDYAKNRAKMQKRQAARKALKE